MNMHINASSNTNIATHNEFGKKQKVLLLMSILLGTGIGWLGFLLFGDLAANSKIMYVSQSEILKLEKERVNQHPKARKLFFGQINQAIELINAEAQKYKDKRSKIIFVVGEFITGEGTLSISKQVHQKVIENLAKVAGNLKQTELELDDSNLEGVNINKQLQPLNNKQ